MPVLAPRPFCVLDNNGTSPKRTLRYTSIAQVLCLLMRRLTVDLPPEIKSGDDQSRADQDDWCPTDLPTEEQ